MKITFKFHPLRAALVFAAGLLAVPGHAAPYLFDAAGDTRAQNVKEVFGKIDLGKDTKAARVTIDVLRTEQLAALDDSFARQRDEQLMRMFDPGSSQSFEERLFQPVTKRLVVLLGSKPADETSSSPAATTWSTLIDFRQQVADIAVDVDAIQELAEELATKRIQFSRRFKVDLPAYDGTAFGDEINKDKEGRPITKRSLLEKELGAQADEAQPLLTRYVRVYDELHTKWEKVRKAAGEKGLLATTWAAIAEKKLAIQALKIEAKEASAVIEKMEKEYQALVGQKEPKPATGDGADDKKEPKSGKDKLAELQKNAGELAKAIEEAPDLVKEKLLPERIGDIDAILKAFASGKVPEGTDSPQDEDVRKATVLVATLPGLVADAGKLVSGRHRPELVKLIFERARLSAQLTGIRQQRQRNEAGIACLQQRLDACMGELAEYQVMIKKWTALRGEARVTVANAWTATYAELRPRPPAKAQAPESLEARRLRVTQGEQLNAVITAALLAVRQHQLAAAAADQKLVLLHYEGAIDAAENAIGLWNTLLAEPINQLAAYYAAGIKPAEAAGLTTQLIGLGAIAWRVK